MILVSRCQGLALMLLDFKNVCGESDYLPLRWLWLKCEAFPPNYNFNVLSYFTVAIISINQVIR